jgi:hypothetical protein
MQSDEEIRAKVRQGRRNKAGPRSFLSKAATPCFRSFIASYYVFFILELLALKMNGALAVPDPEPRLLKANAATPAKLQLLFRPSGKYAASTHFIHVRVPFNFSKLLETPANIFQTYHDYIDKWPEPFRTQVAEVAEISRSCLKDKLNDFSHMLAALPEYKIVRYVNEVAANSDILSFIHKPSDLFLIETSYVYKPDEKTFVLVLHVPLVTPHNLMPLFEFIPLPVYFNFISNVTITPEVGPNNMIAVGHSESYQLLSSSDSQDCNQMGDTYFCKGRNVLLKDLTKTCLGALYLADHSNIQLRCIFLLDSHTYVIYSLGKISTNQVCPKAKSISAIERLRTKIAGKFDADVLIQELETMTKEARTTAQEGILSHWIFTSPGAMIGGTILCLAILFYCWKACNRGQTPLPYPPAPTAPTVFKMTVDPIRR